MKRVRVTFTASLTVEVEAPDNYNPNGTIAEMGDIEESIIQDADMMLNPLDAEWEVEDLQVI